jgi:RND family efflux transporter MFP subunit
MNFIKKRPFIIMAMLLIAGGSYYWYSKSKAGTGVVQYKTAAAEIGTLTTSISASGNVIVDQSATVDPTITGTVADLAVNVGDKVTKGQFLFSIVNDDLSVSVAKAAASYESAKNSLESAKIDRDSADEDYDKAKDDDNYTDDEVDILKDKVDLAKDKIVQAEKSLAASLSDFRNIQANAGKRKVTAQIEGTVNAVNIKNGDDLSRLSGSSNSQAPIIIGDLNTLKARVEVNEVDISSVSVGQKVMLTFNAIDGLSVSGKVEKMDSLGTLTQGVVTYNVTIDFDSLDSRIKPEMSVSAAIITGVKQDVLTVPNSAVKSQNGGSYVQVLKNGQTAPQRVSVEAGISNNTETEIISGISAGDKVVTQTIDPNAAATSASSGGGLGGGGAFRALH